MKKGVESGSGRHIETEKQPEKPNRQVLQESLKFVKALRENFFQGDKIMLARVDHALKSAEDGIANANKGGDYPGTIYVGLDRPENAQHEGIPVEEIISILRTGAGVPENFDGGKLSRAEMKKLADQLEAKSLFYFDAHFAKAGKLQKDQPKLTSKESAIQHPRTELEAYYIHTWSESNPQYREALLEKYGQVDTDKGEKIRDLDLQTQDYYLAMEVLRNRRELILDDEAEKPASEPKAKKTAKTKDESKAVKGMGPKAGKKTLGKKAPRKKYEKLDASIKESNAKIANPKVMQGPSRTESDQVARDLDLDPEVNEAIRQKIARDYQKGQDLLANYDPNRVWEEDTDQMARTSEPKAAQTAEPIEDDQLEAVRRQIEESEVLDGREEQLGKTAEGEKNKRDVMGTLNTRIKVLDKSGKEVWQSAKDWYKNPETQKNIGDSAATLEKNLNRGLDWLKSRANKYFGKAPLTAEQEQKNRYDEMVRMRVQRIEEALGVWTGLRHNHGLQNPHFEALSYDEKSIFLTNLENLVKAYHERYGDEQFNIAVVATGELHRILGGWIMPADKFSDAVLIEENIQAELKKLEEIQPHKPDEMEELPEKVSQFFTKNWEELKDLTKQSLREQPEKHQDIYLPEWYITIYHTSGVETGKVDDAPGQQISPASEEDVQKNIASLAELIKSFNASEQVPLKNVTIRIDNPFNQSFGLNPTKGEMAVPYVFIQDLASDESKKENLKNAFREFVDGRADAVVTSRQKLTETNNEQAVKTETINIAREEFEKFKANAANSYGLMFDVLIAEPVGGNKDQARTEIYKNLSKVEEAFDQIVEERLAQPGEFKFKHILLSNQTGKDTIDVVNLSKGEVKETLNKLLVLETEKPEPVTRIVVPIEQPNSTESDEVDAREAKEMSAAEAQLMSAYYAGFEHNNQKERNDFFEKYGKQLHSFENINAVDQFIGQKKDAVFKISNRGEMYAVETPDGAFALPRFDSPIQLRYAANSLKALYKFEGLKASEKQTDAYGGEYREWETPSQNYQVVKPARIKLNGDEIQVIEKGLIRFQEGEIVDLEEQARPQL